MKTIAISEFKATCLAVLQRVSKTGEPILVTRWGKAVAQVTPPPEPEAQTTCSFGCMAGSAQERGDILEPLPEGDWDALR